jgi:hypothetical protein
MTGKCFLCGQYTAANEHHIFGAANRKKSTKYGLTVNLCLDCHTAGENAVHRNATTMLALHQYGQRKWQDEQGKTAEDFRRVFGKNYL